MEEKFAPYGGPKFDPYATEDISHGGSPRESAEEQENWKRADAKVANEKRTRITGEVPYSEEDTVQYWKDRALAAEADLEAARQDIEQTKKNLRKVQERILAEGMAIVQEFIDETL